MNQPGVGKFAPAWYHRGYEHWEELGCSPSGIVDMILYQCNITSIKFYFLYLSVYQFTLSKPIHYAVLRDVQKSLFCSNDQKTKLISCSCISITTEKVKSKLVRETPPPGHALFRLPYSRQIEESGFYGICIELPFSSVRTNFLEYKPQGRRKAFHLF